MNYCAYIAYPGGSRSHKLQTNSRADVEAHLAAILAETEALGLAESVIIRYGGREILNVPSLTPTDNILQAVNWPVTGAPAKVQKPVYATLYMPEAVREWLAKKGDGKVSAGLRKLVESADIPELKDAWLR